MSYRHVPSSLRSELSDYKSLLHALQMSLKSHTAPSHLWPLTQSQCPVPEFTIADEIQVLFPTEEEGTIQTLEFLSIDFLHRIMDILLYHTSPVKYSKSKKKVWNGEDVLLAVTELCGEEMIARVKERLLLSKERAPTI